MIGKEHTFKTWFTPLPWGNEKGAALVIALVFVIILILIGTTAALITTTDTKIGSNYKASEKAFFVAEAGAQEARERLRASGLYYEITDAHPTAAQWAAYIGSDIKSQKKGYDSTNSMHNRVASLQTDLDYTVKISHQLEDPENPSSNVLFLGDVDGDGDFERHTDTTRGDPNIYLISSYGNAEGGTRVILMEVTRVPPIATKGPSIRGQLPICRGTWR